MCRIFSQHSQDLDSFPKLVSELLKKFSRTSVHNIKHVKNVWRKHQVTNMTHKMILLSKSLNMCV